MIELKRMTIDQPSGLQPAHKLHNVHVLAHLNGEKYVRVYFIKGAVHSQIIDKLALIDGWRGKNNERVS